MEIAKISMKSLRNDEHQQLCSDVRVIALEANPETLRFKSKFDVFDGCCALELEALKKVTRSVYTPQIQEEDNNRDEMFRGLTGANLAATRHYTPTIRDAAVRLQIVFDTYGNITKKPVAEQTSAVTSLVSELSGKHAEDVETVGLKGWVDELSKRNEIVSGLMRDRYNETAGQTDLVMRYVRQETDNSFHKMMRRIDALAEVMEEDEPETLEKIENLIRRLNAAIGRANDILAARQGRGGTVGDKSTTGA